MTIDELKAAVAEKESLSNDLRSKIQANTDAARKLNDDNRVLMKQRGEVQHELHKLQHDLNKAVKAAAEPTE